MSSCISDTAAVTPSNVVQRGYFAGSSRKKRNALRPHWQNEKKLFDIRAARAPQKGWLSGTVVVVDGGKTYCYIKYHPNFLHSVGSLMPLGIGPHKPAYITVYWNAKFQEYDVLCSYLDKSRRILLWRTPEKPSWIWNEKSDIL